MSRLNLFITNINTIIEEKNITLQRLLLFSLDPAPPGKAAATSTKCFSPVLTSKHKER